MVSWLQKRRAGPIGIDIGSRWLKLMQFDGEQADLRAVARYELPSCESDQSQKRDELIVSTLTRARRDHPFRGRDAAVDVGHDPRRVVPLRHRPCDRTGLDRRRERPREAHIPRRLEEDRRFDRDRRCKGCDGALRSKTDVESARRGNRRQIGKRAISGRVARGVAEPERERGR